MNGGDIMLVLTRKIGETIIIGENVHVTVESIERGKVRLGIVAPPAVRVDRQEIHEQRAREAAGKPRVPGLKRSRIHVPLP